MKELRQQAIRLLARRDHTHAELRQKLDGKGTAEEIDAVLADLERRGLLSDERAIASYLRAHGERFGAAKLRQALRAKGADAADIAAGLENAELPDELERARAVWQRKYGSVPQDRQEWAKHARFLQSRGFSVDIIHRLLKEQD